jgi:hypothetical protein
MEATMRKSKAVEGAPLNSEMLNEQIARKAYELYEQRGGVTDLISKTG